ncbi:MAG: deoxyribodipyrimidine photo-lyase, partial [Saprospiraceae bacterium]|nr:deoxyribodipyrimidine photo-lyase [Saprospiraceae bacterium]MCB9309836.1 deoxyribodipyrimidine photo-lyase [Lewinellaceae bacterium]
MNEFNISPSPIIIYWMRRDLRLHDNPALQKALSSGFPVQIIFIFDTNILNSLKPHDARVHFIHSQLKKIYQEVSSLGASLMLYHGIPEDIFKNLLNANTIKSIYANEDFEPYGINRDQTIKSIANTFGSDLILSKDHVIFSPNELLKADGTPYTVYTPFSKKWIATLMEDNSILQNFECDLGQLRQCHGPHTFPQLEEIGFKASEINFPSEKASKETISNYLETKDFPFLDGTSRLGIHLRFGTISIRSLVKTVLELNETYLKELIWREFYIMILYHFPFVVDLAFKEDFRRIVWENREDHILAWKEGRTGFPIVDAGMRQLVATGFMHNRVRMITASCLTKHLLCDWKIGESFFAEHLLDFELASNNGGWQWSAGTGTDAAPYFRIFNPHLQTEKFDPQHQYIKKWIPEFDVKNYLHPIIDHTFARERCLQAYKSSAQSK